MSNFPAGTKGYFEDKKREAVEWAKTLLTRPFVILDYETTGFDQEPVQVALIDHLGNTLVNTLVKPMTWEISPGAMKVHGITNVMVQKDGVPTFAHLWQKHLRDWLHQKTVVAYNAAFETQITDITVTTYNLTPADIHWECAMLAYAAYYGAWNDWHQSFTWQKLEPACKAMQVEVDGSAHDALTDVRMTLGLIQAMADHATV